MTNHAIVSDPSENLILVDSEDREVGAASKGECHAGQGMLHRAFSVFLFDSKQRLLLQRRSEDKPLWPLYWSNSCCSHPRQGETIQIAAARRLREELSVACPLHFVYKFKYHAHFGEVGSEHELCHVLVGRYDGPIRANANEIDATRLVALADIDAEIEAEGDRFTPWFKLEWGRVRDYLSSAPESLPEPSQF
ncbi:MAG: isopentenyl-diphosphate Delta-isomerase [Pseudomonadota bacterium]